MDMAGIRPFYLSEQGYVEEEFFEKQIELQDPLHIGIKLEVAFAKAVSNIPYFRLNSWIFISENSAISCPEQYDVYVASKLAHYWFEVKGTDGNRIYAELTPEYIEKKLYFPIQDKDWDTHQYYFAFPKFNASNLDNPNNWYIHRITPDSYLTKLHSKPYYPKLVENSEMLTRLPYLPFKLGDYEGQKKRLIEAIEYLKKAELRDKEEYCKEIDDKYNKLSKIIE